MASRLRAPAGSKLARPVHTGTSLKAPGVAKPSSRPPPQQQQPPVGQYEVPQSRTAPAVGGARRHVGQVRQVKQAASAGSVPPSQRPVERVPQTSIEPPTIELGDRVLCNGDKAGVVAFLGTTQFASGIWAGVVLDTYDGKNNGSVKGVQYFQCEPNTGLFARPEKLSLLAKASEVPSQPKQQQPTSPPDFGMGDHVLVDGTKPGIIAFYGNTEFARGTWVGVVLDAQEGKNDGKVAGIQYFVCEPNHGLFTRPQKLTLVSKAGSKQNHVQPHLAVQENSVRSTSQQRSTQSTPIGSEELKLLHDKLQVGDRVLVGGAKEGFLRYLGPTDFAKGIWAGVELEEPLGKNDGTVSGKRYFQCEPKYGLFAPLPKVEKLASAADEAPEIYPLEPPLPSPPSTKHTVPPPYGPARHLSSSSASSLSSAARQPQDLAASSSLHGSTSAGLSELLQEKDAIILSLQTSMEEGDRDKMRLNEQITDLSRQMEDLQFRFEEQGVISGDQLESVAGDRETVITDLQSQLDQERKNTARLQEQLQSLQGSDSSSELQFRVSQLEARLGEREREVTSHLSTISELHSEVSSLQTARSSALEKVEDVSKRLASKEDEKLRVQTDLESSKATISELCRQLKAAEDQCHWLGEDKSELESRLSQLSQLSGDSSQQLTFLTEQLQEKERQLGELHSLQAASTEEAQKAKHDLQLAQEHSVNELERIKSANAQELQNSEKRIAQLTLELQQANEMQEGEKQRIQFMERDFAHAESATSELQLELASVKQDLQEAMDLCSQHEALIEERNSELSTMQSEIRLLTKEQELWSNERSRLITEQERLASERDRAQADCDRLMAETASVSSEQNELVKQRRELMNERDHLLAERQVMQTEHERVLGERDELVHSLSELQQQRQSVVGQSHELNLKYKSTQTELSEALGEVERLNLEILTLQEGWEHEKLSLQEEIELAQVSSNELQQRIENSSSERDSTLQEAQEIADRLDSAEREKDQLQLALELAQNQIDELQFQLDELSKSHRQLERETTLESSAIQQRLEVTESLLADRERELAEAIERVTSLEEELVISGGKRDEALLEEEKQLLEERVKELTLQLEKTQQMQKRASFVAPSEQERLEELDVETLSSRLQEAQTQILEAHVQQEAFQQSITDLEQEVEFLNSVIADLQRKLETAEALAGLHGPVGEEEYADDEDAVLGLPPPRLFCDICDVFDQHDTDDCPLQATSDSPPPTMYHGQRAPGGSDRPYCENCEVFGHSTEECEYDVTY